MPPGPVSPEEGGFSLNSRHGGLTRGPSTSFHRPALHAQAVRAENKGCRELLGGGDSGTQLPAGPP